MRLGYGEAASRIVPQGLHRLVGRQVFHANVAVRSGASPWHSGTVLIASVLPLALLDPVGPRSSPLDLLPLPEELDESFAAGRVGPVLGLRH